MHTLHVLDENAAMKFEDGLFVKQVIEKVKEDVTHVLSTKVNITFVCVYCSFKYSLHLEEIDQNFIL